MGHEVTLEIARRAAAAVPKLADVPIVSVWSGVRPMSRDGLPLIGFLREVEGFRFLGDPQLSRTLQGHLSRILTKLDIASRSELAGEYTKKADGSSRR